ncbi:hypothetical protein HAX54_020317 [Datura stramonium]|uniref:Aminotransferase-like plant mobile domain-containing protein n=1 Tax=Datura stramonium TaxID=4076 RepID=A0ABS8USV1_DATST|nr:hypothetical protein [Datura stramonium]
MSSSQENFSQSATNNERKVVSTFDATKSSRATVSVDPLVQQQHHRHQLIFGSLTAPNCQSDMVQKDQNPQENWPEHRRGKAPIHEPLEEVDETVLVADILPRTLNFFSDCHGENHDNSVDRYESLIREKDLPRVRLDCGWSSDVDVSVVHEGTRITHHIDGFSLIYTYPFTIGIGLPVPQIIEELCRWYKICLAQLSPQVWRLVACIQHLANLAEVDFFMEHLINLYSPRFSRGGIFHLTPRGKMGLITNTEDDFDQGWYERFVIIPTEQLHRPAPFPFPESWSPNGLWGKKPTIRLPPSLGATTTSIQSTTAKVASSRRRGISPCAALSDSTKRRRVTTLTEPDVKGINSHLLQLLQVERNQRGTISKVVEVEDDDDEGEDDNSQDGEEALVESTTGFEPLGFGEEKVKDEKSSSCVPNFEVGISDPTSRRVVVNIPKGVDLLRDFSIAAQVFESLLGPEEKARLEKHDLENSFTQVTQPSAVATQEKASDQTDKFMTYSNDVKHLKSSIDVLQAEVSELRSMNAWLQVGRTSVVQQLKEIQREQKEREVSLSILTITNKKLKEEVSLKANECSHLYSAHNTLQERVTQLEADLALVGELHDKDEMEKARLKSRLNALRVRHNADRYAAELERMLLCLLLGLAIVMIVTDNSGKVAAATMVVKMNVIIMVKVVRVVKTDISNWQ